MMIDCDLRHAMTTIFRGEISIEEIDKHIFDLQTKKIISILKISKQRYVKYHHEN